MKSKQQQQQQQYQNNDRLDSCTISSYSLVQHEHQPSLLSDTSPEKLSNITRPWSRRCLPLATKVIAIQSIELDPSNIERNSYHVRGRCTTNLLFRSLLLFFTSQAPDIPTQAMSLMGLVPSNSFVQDRAGLVRQPPVCLQRCEALPMSDIDFRKAPLEPWKP